MIFGGLSHNKLSLFFHKAPSVSSLASELTFSIFSECDPDDARLYTHHVTEDATSIDNEFTHVEEIAQISGATPNADADR